MHASTEDLAEQHYAEHEGKPFFGELVEFITSGPLVAMVLEGHEAVKAARQVIGATNPLEAAPGSIRGDFALEVGQNMVHGSDSAESGRARDRDLLPGALAGPRADARPRQPLAAAARDPRRARRRVRGAAGGRRRGGRRARRSRSRARTRCARRSPAGAAAGRRRRSASTRSSRSTARSTASPPTPRPRARRCERLCGRTHEVVSGLALLDADGAVQAAHCGDRGHLPRRSTTATLDWYVATGEWRDARAATRSRGAGGALVRAHRRRLPQRRRAAGGHAAGPDARAC